MFTHSYMIKFFYVAIIMHISNVQQHNNKFLKTTVYISI